LLLVIVPSPMIYSCQCHYVQLPTLLISPFSFFSSFFFYSSRDHRDLHSFPRRRSSDLYSEQDFCHSCCAVLRWSQPRRRPGPMRDRKSTRLNSSHGSISYAVFCLKKKKRHG